MYSDKKSKISSGSPKQQNKSHNDWNSHTKTYKKQKLGKTISNQWFMGKTKLLKTADSNQAYAWIHGLNNCHYCTQNKPNQMRSVNSEAVNTQFTSYINSSMGQNQRLKMMSIEQKPSKNVKNRNPVMQNNDTDDASWSAQQDITCFEVGRSSTESLSSNSSDEELYDEVSFYKKKRKMRKLIKRANEELFMASEKGNLDIVRKLIIESKSTCKPDINFKGPDFITPLYAAVSEGHYHVVDFLLKSGARTDVRTVCERTPLHIACLRGYTEIVKLIVKNSPELINWIDSYGNTPAHYAAKYGNTKTLMHLLKYNPTLFIKNNKEKTPIDVSYDSEIIEIFGKYVNRIKKNLDSMTKRSKGINIIPFLIFHV